MRDVACPVLIRAGDLLIFRHPLAGVQLVKGGIKDGETPQRAALRELHEEAGVTATSTGSATPCTTIQTDERWWLCPVTTTGLPNQWTHHCADDGGHDFAFFWHALASPLPDADPRFERARQIIKALMTPNQG